MAELCSCGISIMTQEQARPGWLMCSACCGTWFTPTSRPYKLDADNALRIGEFIASGGLVAGVWPLRQVVFIPAYAVIAPPGKAHLIRCPDCIYAASRGYPCDCGETGLRIYHACVNCGDTTTWLYGNTGGEDDSGNMTCQKCGARWDQSHPGWIAQRVPEGAAPAAAVG